MGAQELFGGGVAVITGAGSGIGAGLARYASQLGMTTVLADVDAEAVATLRDELTAAGATAVDAVCDVRDADAVQALADRVNSDIGPVRLLVNNAGIEQFGYLWDTPVANWERVMDINVSGVFHGVRAFLPAMLATDEPAWVWNMSSVGGVSTVQLQAPYIVSKHAVLALTECLRVEVELAGHDDHVCVQAVLPGPVQSNIFAAAGGVDSTGGDAADALTSDPSRRPPGDEVQAIAEAFNDMTHRIESQAAREQRQVADHREMMASVAHDLRTPLTALHGHLEALAADAMPDPARGAAVLQAALAREHYDAVVLDITIADGTVNPANAELSARINEPITLNVTSDADDELHVHAVPEHEFEVKPGAAQRFEFTVDVPGRVEIELHHLNRTVAVLQVRP